MEAIISYKPNAQKRPGLFDRILTQEVLLDICLLVTGQSRFRVVKDHSTYNKGRLLFIEYAGIVNYVSLSEASIE